jgi:electron transport complex protein RnfA
MLLSAVASENAVFSRALGLNKYTLMLKSPRSGILYGVATTWMLFLSSLLASAVNYLLEDVSLAVIVSAPLYIVCVLTVYFATLFALRYIGSLSELYRAAAPVLPLCAFNTALFGALLFSGSMRFTFWETIGYSLGTGIGYTLSLLIIYYARKRLSLSPVPRSFKGLPILLIYIGLLSLAIYGLVGHGLPV